jgi:hypothetical protein
MYCLFLSFPTPGNFVGLNVILNFKFLVNHYIVVLALRKDLLYANLARPFTAPQDSRLVSICNEERSAILLSFIT